MTLLYFNILYYTILHYNILHFFILCPYSISDTIPYYAMIYYTILYCTKCYELRSDEAPARDGQKANTRSRFRTTPGVRGPTYPNRESLKIGSPAGLRPAEGTILKLSQLESGRNPARNTDFRPGSTTA